MPKQHTAVKENAVCVTVSAFCCLFLKSQIQCVDSRNVGSFFRWLCQVCAIGLSCSASIVLGEIVRQDKKRWQGGHKTL